MNLRNIFSRDGAKKPEDKADRFWKWFRKNHQQFLFIASVSVEEKDRMLNEFLKELHKYDEFLYFEMGGHPDNQKLELIITAEGNVEAFPSVEFLVSKAPQFESWEVIAFKPPMGTGFSVKVEGHTFEPDATIFVPLHNPEEPEELGIKIYYSDYTEEERKIFIKGSFLMLDVILGEKSCAMDLDYIDVGEVPENISDYAFRSLDTIQSFIAELKGR